MKVYTTKDVEALVLKCEHDYLSSFDMLQNEARGVITGTTGVVEGILEKLEEESNEA